MGRTADEPAMHGRLVINTIPSSYRALSFRPLSGRPDPHGAKHWAFQFLKVVGRHRPAIPEPGPLRHP